jgi:hypothetical protein
MSARGDYGCQYRPRGFFAAVSITVTASVSTAVTTATMSAAAMTTATTPAGRNRHRSGLRCCGCGHDRQRCSEQHCCDDGLHAHTLTLLPDNDLSVSERQRAIARTTSSASRRRRFARVVGEDTHGRCCRGG